MLPSSSSADDADDPPTLRSLLPAQHGSFCADARTSLRVTLAPASYYASADALRSPQALPPNATFAPTFTHQVFEEDIIFGYREPALRVWYRDPDLAVCVTATATSALAAEAPVRLPTEPGKAALTRVPADDVLARLRAAGALPAAFPGASFTAAVGPAASARALALPPFFLDETPGAEPWRAPGVIEGRYARGAATFTVRAFRPAAARKYHARLHALALWTIENASAVDSSDEKWEQLTVHCDATSGGGGSNDESLVAFALLYRFTHPLRETRPDTLRLAQLVVVPRWQRAGHGEALLEHIMARARGDPRLLEVGIEDPCEGMSRLRDAVDVARAFSSRVFSTIDGWADFGPRASDAPARDPPAADDALALIVDLDAAVERAAQAALGVTLRQVRAVHTVLLLARLGGPAAVQGDVLRAYRLFVKRGIFNANADVRATTNVDARKAVLEDLFVETFAAAVAALARTNALAETHGEQELRAGRAPAVALASREEAAHAAAAWAARKKEIELTNARAKAGRA